MTRFGKIGRAAIVLGAAADLVAFSGVSVLKLTGIGVGIALAMLGLAYAYRQPGAIGMLMVSATAAASIEITSLQEVRELLTAVIGLLIPVSMLAWVSLTAEEDRIERHFRGRPLALTSVYGVLCVLSVPTTILVLSFFVTGVSMRITTMAEAAIVLLVAVAGGLLLTFERSAPAAVVAAAEEEPR